MKIKIIQSIFEAIVQNKVNDFITQKEIKVLELQYRATIWGYSVMIVYEDMTEGE